jgi:hypothetical protein
MRMPLASRRTATNPSLATMATSVYEPPSTASQAIKQLILPLYLPCWFDSVSMGIIGPVLPLFVLSLGATEALTGIVVSTVAAGRLSFSVPGGKLVGKVGEKKAIQFGLLVYSALLCCPPPLPASHWHTTPCASRAR